MEKRAFYERWRICNLFRKRIFSRKNKGRKQVGLDAAEAFAKNGTWHSEVQIPKNSFALNPDGSINWSRAPQGGYL